MLTAFGTDGTMSVRLVLEYLQNNLPPKNLLPKPPPLQQEPDHPRIAQKANSAIQFFLVSPINRVQV